VTARAVIASLIASLIALAAAAPAAADRSRDRGKPDRDDRDDRDDREARDDRDRAESDVTVRDAEQLVLVNAMAELGDAGQVARLRRALEARGLLLKLPDPIEAALEGRTQLSVDVDPIRDAYADFDYDRAEDLIDDQEGRILDDAAAGDPTTALAELTLWRGLLAAAQDQPEDAVRWFRGAYRLNSALRIDPKFAAPRVRQLVKRARREAEESGELRIESDPADALVSVDGGEARPIPRELELQIGLHLVVISAAGRSPYAEMIEIRAGKPEVLEIALEPETRVHRAARLVDQTAAAAPGKARLKRAGALSRITGAKRILVVEDGSDDHVTLRLYDVSNKRVSRQFDLSGAASTTSIARIVQAALDSDDNMLHKTDGGSSLRWYKRWYVWAAVGAVAVVGGYFTYQSMQREPDRITGF
jgi:hypothetical protein